MIYSYKEIKKIIVVTVIVFMLFGFICNTGDAAFIQIIKAYEMFLLPFMGCWSISGFVDFVDSETREVFLSYSRSRMTIGLIRILSLTLGFIFLCTLLFWGTFFGENINRIYFVGICAEIFFWSSLGYLLLMTLRNIMVSISIIWIYTAIQILDVQHYFKIISIYVYDCDGVASIILKTVLLFILSGLLAIIAQKRFSIMTIDGISE